MNGEMDHRHGTGRAEARRRGIGGESDLGRVYCFSRIEKLGFKYSTHWTMTLVCFRSHTVARTDV